MGQKQAERGGPDSAQPSLCQRGGVFMFRVLSCLNGEHDLRLVILAVAVCFVTSLVAINLFQRARQDRKRSRWFWIAPAGIVSGCGIWATHFIAMLAYQPGMPV